MYHNKIDKIFLHKVTLRIDFCKHIVVYLCRKIDKMVAFNVNLSIVLQDGRFFNLFEGVICNNVEIEVNLFVANWKS